MTLSKLAQHLWGGSRKEQLPDSQARILSSLGICMVLTPSPITTLTSPVAHQLQPVHLLVLPKCTPDTVIHTFTLPCSVCHLLTSQIPDRIAKLSQFSSNPLYGCFLPPFYTQFFLSHPIKLTLHPTEYFANRIRVLTRYYGMYLFSCVHRLDH